MNREKLYVNPERFEEELKRHRGQYHPIERINGRRARLWVQADIAAIINLSKERLSTVKQGKDAISERALLDLARAWGVNWKWLCNLSDSRTEEEERKEKFISRLDERYEKIDREMEYMKRLGFVAIPSPETYTVTVYYRHGDNPEPEKMLLSFDQFKSVRDAMNRAAATTVLSCFNLLNVSDIDEPDPEDMTEEEKKKEEEEDGLILDYIQDRMNRFRSFFENITGPEDNHPDEEAPSE